MQTFLNWLDNINEGTPIDWKPTSRIGYDPLTSALEKIQRNQGHLPFSGNYMSLDALKIKLGLDNEEFESLKRIKLFVRSDDGNGGWNIDKNKFISIFKQIRKFSPKID